MRNALVRVGANDLLCHWRHHRKPVEDSGRVGYSLPQNLAAKRLNRIVSLRRAVVNQHRRTKAEPPWPGHCHHLLLLGPGDGAMPK